MNLDETSDDTLVILQFTDLDDANYCAQFSNKFKTIDIAANSPIIQIGNRFYSGRYANNVGTYLLFEQTIKKKADAASSAAAITSDSESAAEYNSCTTEYSGKTFKKLVLNRLFLEEKKATD